MAREYFLAAAFAGIAAFGCVAVTPRAACAQSLQRLTIDAFDLSADTPNPRVDATFHLIVRLHVRERVNAVQNLELPILAQLELLGDERSIGTNSAGTEYRETITVVSHNLGTLTIGPATLQAIDARDGRPKQYATNNLTVQVVGEPFQPLQQSANAAASALEWTARAALWLGGLACVATLIGLIFLRRPAVISVSPVAPPVMPAVSPSPRERLRDALTVLRAERSRSAAVTVRAAVWNLMGVSEGATLADVLRRPAASDARMADALRSLERAAFTYDGDLEAAVAAACAALERL
ncbi:MAG: hypothetical protein JO092_09120 [Candidatus Eremiobacteraeota bacterium]|nr:hypothetical protein [Candidatus Eremiobacteraeota bacterium]